MTTTSAAALRHEFWCLPRVGADEVRIESYDTPRYGEDGITQIGIIRVTRCVECGVTHYVG